MCTDPDGAACFPLYGIGPHIHKPRGGTVLLPGVAMPGYTENPNEPGHGVHWCPHCGDGKPESMEHVTGRIAISSAHHTGETRMTVHTDQVHASLSAFIEMAERDGFDTAHSWYDDKGWVFLSPPTADIWKYWQAARRAPVVPVSQGWRDGLMAVADMLKKTSDAYADAHGHDDMGGLSFGSGAHADAKLDHHSHLLELEEEVRAMLAAAPQPPEAACTPSMQPWKDHLTAQLVGDLTEVARKYHGAQQLRERIAGLVRPLCDRVKDLEADHSEPALDMVPSLMRAPGHSGDTTEMVAVQARKRLTKEEILKAIRGAKKIPHDHAGWVREQRIEYGRAIERALGIQEQTT